MSGYDVLVAGEYYCDLIFGAIDAPPRLGDEVIAESLSIRAGGSYTTALALTRLGVRTAWACDFGTDLFSRLVVDSARSDGLDPVAFRHLDRTVQFVSAAFADRSERGFITYRETTVSPPDLRLLADHRPRWLLQSYRYTPDWLAFMRGARAAGIRIYGDCAGDRAALDAPGIREFIGLCDVFSSNAVEALTLTGTSSIEAALHQLGALCPAVVIKRGEDGAIAMVDGVHYSVSAPPVTVADTVGAGDAFSAGYLAAELKALPVRDRLLNAVACGSLSVTGPGNAATPTAEQLSEFLARIPESSRQTGQEFR